MGLDGSVGIHISIENLHKIYVKGPEQVHVLRGLDLEIKPDSRLAVTGVSGAGKSTLLHVLGTLERPTSGRVLFDDDDVFRRRARELAAFRNRQVGFVFQFHYLLDEFSALENAAMPLLVRGLSRKEALARAERFLEWTGLGDRLTHLPAQLSGGEQQRVAIARALVGEPPLLLMDEPTGNLDAETADEIHRLIVESAAASGASLVVVTHNQDFAAEFPDRRHLESGQFRD